MFESFFLKKNYVYQFFNLFFTFSSTCEFSPFWVAPLSTKKKIGYLQTGLILFWV